MTFQMADDCSKLGLRAGAIIFQGVQIADSPGALKAEIADEVNSLRERYADASALRATPEVAMLHGIYRAIGLSPRKIQPASQRLAQLALKRGGLPSINNLVDGYNLISVRSLCCLGAHDLDQLSLPVSLRLLHGDESFTPLGGGESEEPVNQGEFAYVDAANRVICRLDVVQADFSRVTSETKNVLLIVEGTTVYGEDKLRKIFSDAIDLVTRYCGGSHQVAFFPY